MKIDISTIVVILFTLLFIFLGGLSKRRKKVPAAGSKIKFKQPFSPGQNNTDFLKDAVTMMNDPLARLEKMFKIPEEEYVQEGESLEFETVNEPSSLEVTDIKATSLEVTDSKKSSLEAISDKESQSLEVIVDEVAEYLKEKDKSVSKPAVQPDEMDLTYRQTGKTHLPGKKVHVPLVLFKNFDDFKKAVIYSEIMNRKEF
jgi:hypothetical protein